MVALAMEPSQLSAMLSSSGSSSPGRGKKVTTKAAQNPLRRTSPPLVTWPTAGAVCASTPGSLGLNGKETREREQWDLRSTGTEKVHAGQKRKQAGEDKSSEPPRAGRGSSHQRGRQTAGEPGRGREPRPEAAQVGMGGAGLPPAERRHRVGIGTDRLRAKST